MSHDAIRYRETRDLPIEQILPLYRENGWSAAQKPAELARGLADSHALVSAWDGDTLVGLGNALSDGSLVVYYPHLLVLPRYQGRGIGRRILEILTDKYRELHQQVLLADGGAVAFYEKCGFRAAGSNRAMWIYAGDDHEPGAPSASRRS